MVTKQKAAHHTDRQTIGSLEEIVNVGSSIAADLRSIGVESPQKLIGRDPWELYRALCRETREVQDPCVLDVFMAAVDYMNGHPPKKWWEYTPNRKQQYSAALERFSL